MKGHRPELLGATRPCDDTEPHRDHLWVPWYITFPIRCAGIAAPDEADEEPA